MINKKNNTPATLAINATFGSAVKKAEGRNSGVASVWLGMALATPSLGDHTPN